MPEAFPFEITEYGPSGPQQVHIEAIREVPLTIYLNDRELDCDEDELVALTLGVASGATTKAEAAVFVAPRMR